MTLPGPNELRLNPEAVAQIIAKHINSTRSGSESRVRVVSIEFGGLIGGGKTLIATITTDPAATPAVPS